MRYRIEACVDSVQSAIEAEKGGAERVELCGNLIIGGTSPGKALFRQVREHTNLEIRVLLRPRFGDFCYDAYEFAEMKEDIMMYRELGADGIVTGILKPDGSLNREELEELAVLAGDMDMALHRAFDVCRDPFKALELSLIHIWRNGSGNRFRRHADDGRGRRRWLYRNYCGMAGTAQPAGNSDCHGSVQHSGKGQQRCAVFLRSVLRQCGRASGNYPVLHSGMRAVHTV